MLKSLAVLGVVVIFASGKPYDAGSNKTQRSPQQPTPVTTYTYDSNCCTTQAPRKSDAEVHHWYTPLQNPDWWLVIVGGAAGLLAWRTIVAIKKQANIQAAGLKQWVDVQVTDCDCKTTYELGGIAIHAEEIKLWFKAANPTPYPLTIKEITVAVSPFLGDPNFKPFTKTEEVILSPGKDRQSVIGQRSTYDHNFYITIPLTESQIVDYKLQRMFVSIIGRVEFKPVIGKIESQHFGYLVTCGYKNVHVLPYGSELVKGKTEEEYESDQRPN